MPTTQTLAPAATLTEAQARDIAAAGQTEFAAVVVSLYEARGIAATVEYTAPGPVFAVGTTFVRLTGATWRAVPDSEENWARTLLVASGRTLLPLPGPEVHGRHHGVLHCQQAGLTARWITGRPAGVLTTPRDSDISCLDCLTAMAGVA